ncbi:MAG TPA: SBBP repeat-containing protein, partial [bacterium]|nr:SBBP repeat-containing protein [bacterium]
MRLEGADPKADWRGAEFTGGTANYFIGNDPTKWHTKIPLCTRVTAKNVYPGIDMAYYGNQRRLEYDFTIRPGADPTQLRLVYGNTSDAKVDPDGNLLLKIGNGKVVFKAPLIYQTTSNNLKESVQGRYVVRRNGEVGFEVAAYDSSRPLVIDPVLDYSTYLGGTGTDSASAIALDSSGNAYITGTTSSTNFPTTAGAYKTTNAGLNDVFVTKLNNLGTGLSYSTYIGGTGSEGGMAIAVDSGGNAYVTGNTNSTNFPTTAGVLQTANAGQTEVFVAKLNPTGTGLSYSTYLGGNGADFGQAIAIDSSGDAYVGGYTNSTTFPTTAGAFQTALSGGINYDGFVAKINPTATSLLYSTYLGGTNNDYLYGIAVNSSGNAFVTGSTTSVGFPTTAGAFQTTYGGVDNAFITELNTTGTGLVVSTFLGGTNGDGAYAIALDSTGDVFVTGVATSQDFPITPGAFQTVHSFDSINYDAFITKFNPALSSLVYSTYLGGNAADYAQAITVDSAGNAYVLGYTNSTTFPTTPGAFQIAHALDSPSNSNDVFLAKLNASGSGLLYCTYLGGNGVDIGSGLAIDAGGNAYLTGYTSSNNFPTSSGAYQTALSGGTYDAFVTKFDTTVFMTPTPCGFPGNTCTPTPTPVPNSTPCGQYLVYDSGSQDIADAIAVDGSGNVYVGGYSSTGSPPPLRVIKYDPNGIVQWNQTYGAGVSCILNGLTLDSSGNVYAVGSQQLASQRVYLMVKYNSAGVNQWAVTYDGTGGLHDNDANAAVIDPTNTYLYVTGQSWTSTNWDFMTLKYNLAGVLQAGWPVKYDSVGNHDRAIAITTDPLGNLYVGGQSDVSAVSHDRLIKYNSSGVSQWNVTYTTNASWADLFQGLAMDPTGNYLYVNGLSNNGSNNGTRLSKYDTAGNLIWTVPYYQTGFTTQGWGVQTDPQGNVYTVMNDTTNNKYHVLKYDPNGQLIWENYFTRGLGADISGAIAVHGTDVWVTG